MTTMCHRVDFGKPSLGFRAVNGSAPPTGLERGEKREGWEARRLLLGMEGCETASSGLGFAQIRGRPGPEGLRRKGEEIRGSGAWASRARPALGPWD